jgi:hypothetical protein
MNQRTGGSRSWQEHLAPPFAVEGCPISFRMSTTAAGPS